jgi:hypothetical protein
MGRRYVGIDIDPAYVAFAEARGRDADGAPPPLRVGRARYPGKDELAAIARAEAGSDGRRAGRKHKCQTYGRKIAEKKNDQPSLV